MSAPNAMPAEIVTLELPARPNSGDISRLAAGLEAQLRGDALVVVVLDATQLRRLPGPGVLREVARAFQRDRKAISRDVCGVVFAFTSPMFAGLARATARALPHAQVVVASTAGQADREASEIVARVRASTPAAA